MSNRGDEPSGKSTSIVKNIYGNPSQYFLYLQSNPPSTIQCLYNNYLQRLTEYFSTGTLGDVEINTSNKDGSSGKGSPATGASLGMLSMVKNKRIMTIIGGVLIAIGIAGMIAVGSNAMSTLLGGGFSQPNQGEGFQMRQYAFMFIMIGGLAIVIYSQVALQSKRAKERERGSRAG